MGADRAILVTTDQEVEPLAVAKLLQKIAAEEQPGMVIMGKQEIADDSNQNAQMPAALLGWEQCILASMVEVDVESPQGNRETHGGLLPANSKPNSHTPPT